MSWETALLMLTAMAVWTLANVLKAARAVIVGNVYRFARWDGGTMRAGQSLTPRGTHLKLVWSSLVFFGIVGLMAGLLPMRTGGWALAVLTSIGIIADSVTVAR